MKKFRIAILLGTYNGAPFIEQQILSIQRQTCSEWRLIVRDDESDDGTIDIIDKIASCDNRIHQIKGGKDLRLGVVENYALLMKKAFDDGADIVFFCDQDDIWRPQKIELQSKKIESTEKRYGKRKPILIHSDLAVVDQNLSLIDPSFLKYQGIRHEKINPLNVLLAQNFVTGCASAVNRALLKLVLPIPEKVVMHDWWLALCAAIWGKIDFIDRPLVFYRQHANNKIGAKKFWHTLNPMKEDLLLRWQTGHYNFVKSIAQAQALMNRVCENPAGVDPCSKKLIQTYATCLNENRIKRIRTITENHIHRQKFIFQLLLYIRLLSTKKVNAL